MLVLTTTYAHVTGTPAPADYAELHARVVRRVEALLGRTLVAGTYTERLTAHADGCAYPSATPVTGCDRFGFDRFSVRTGPGTHDVTYSGGFTADTIPYDLAEAIAWGIHTLASGGSTPALAAGLSSVSIAGEYTATVAAGTTIGRDGHPLPERLGFAADLGGRCVSAALRYRRVMK
jgi:hypothetical protein